MSKIRINELARELEVKPGAIIDQLPELGVLEKKTHSSSLDDDVAEMVRQHFSGAEAQPKASSRRPPPTAETEPEPQTTASRQMRLFTPPVATPLPETHAAQPTTATAPGPATAAVEPEVETPEIPPTPVIQPFEQPKIALRSAKPIRPPLAGERQTAPLRPPAAAAAPAAHPPDLPPLPAQIGRRASPLVPPVAPGSRGAIPVQPVVPPQPPPAEARGARPAPPPRVPGAPRPAPQAPAPGAIRPPQPGQILSGPRQPLPPGLESKPMAPGMPVPPPKPPPPPQRQVMGQPPARPVVPPRPDLVERLRGQSRTSPAPGAPRPGAPRPGAPRSPAPGQPIYRGPIRPGMPVMRGPGMPGAPAPAGRPRGRGMHPTTPLAAEPTLVPTDTRRHPQKGAHKQRDREIIEGKLRPISARPREANVIAPNKEITIGEGITVKELAEKLGIKASLVIKKLVDRKIFATINQTLDLKLAEDLASVFGASSSQMSFEEETTWEVELAEDNADLSPRAPVVTVMGHVDHGKTSLLDVIRSADVADHEAGGITQHIGAYQIRHGERKIVFIDTPGHEAFTRMRARGARVTDIVILVVAADDGVMPQTLEAIDHAKAAKVPIIVAINKIDKPDATPDRIKQQLSDRGLLAEDWGGDVPMIPVSAKARQNIDLLLEYVGIVSDLQNLRANPARPAICTVLEAKLDRGRGPVATVLVRNGTLRSGDSFICGTVFSRVRALVNDHGDTVSEAEPSTPVEVLGLDSLPDVGDTLQVVTDTAKAKQIVEFREHKAREIALAKTNRITLETLHEQLREGEVKELNVIIKADVGGSAEVLSEALQKLSTDKVRVKVLHTGVGAITETDVLLASASDAIIIGFNVRPERTAAQVADQENVEIRLHTIIYDLTQEMKKAMAGLLEPVIKETFRGRLEVKEAFRVTKVGTVAGCLVIEGAVQKGNEVRLLRDNVVVHTGKVAGLRRFKDEVNEVRAGVECGVSIANYNDIKPGDIIETFTSEKIAAVLN